MEENLESDIYLTIPFDSYKMNVEQLLQESANLYNIAPTDEEGLTAYESSIKAWENKAETFLKTSFSIEQSSFYYNFRSAQPIAYNIPGVKRQVSPSKRTKDLQELLRYKDSALLSGMMLVSVSDKIQNPNNTLIENRAKYSIDEKLSLLVEKLYDLYGDSYHSIKDILTGNGIALKKYDEDRDFLRILERQGLVEQFPGETTIYTRLTTEGALYVEEQQKSHPQSYSKISDSADEIHKKFDEILKKLEQLDCGNEILFTELQDLKDLYSKLNKKNWGQLLKGKLLDLALAKATDNDVLQYIYNTFTDNPLQIPNL